MTFARKTPVQKLRTKIDKALRDNEALTEHNGVVKIKNEVLFNHDGNSIEYGKIRYFPSRKDEIIKADYKVSIPLSHLNLMLLGSNITNPPQGSRKVVDVYQKLTGNNVSKITIGAEESKFDRGSLYVTKEIYEAINKIDKDEGIDKIIRVKNRAIPFLNNAFGLELEQQGSERDYSLLLEEIIQSGQYTQEDIISFTSKLEAGESRNVVIDKQVNRQVGWLIEVITEIVDEDNLTKSRAQELGNIHFGFPKTKITGPEHLMEMILTKYGRNTLFGVPVLLNTDKYITHAAGLSRSQFDIVLVNHLCDVEVVELKRPDCYLLEYDQSRGKFYPSKELSVAISQAERYISTVNKDNDEEYKICGKKIRDFLNEQITEEITVEICRPKAIIIVGSFKTLVKSYERLSAKAREKITERDYRNNSMQAYKEIKSAFRNIDILTYSELIETARARLKTSD